MTAGVAISVEQYLETTYRPDCDYVDGELVERNVGEWDHSRAQMLLSRYLSNREAEWGIVVVTEQRVQVKPERFRVPDILAVVAPAAATPIVRHPPLLCIEILSRDDRMQDMQARIEDYLTFGVPSVWVLNPTTRRGFVYTSEGMREAKDGILRVADSPIAVPIAELE
jgi:Uma2 family endonuclease